MREASRIVAVILRELAEAVAPGVPTMFFEELARKRCADFGVKPAFLGMYGFPYALCCSVNEQVVHGFPSERKLEPGDLVSFDMGVVYDGFYGDSATTVPVGPVDATSAKLLAVTRESLAAGIAQALEGNDLYDISRAVQKYVEERGLGVVKTICWAWDRPQITRKAGSAQFRSPGRAAGIAQTRDGPGHRGPW